MRTTVFALMLALAGCSIGQRTAEMGAPQRPAVSVAVSADALWSAVLATLADRSIPVKSSDKAGGVIASEEAAIAPADMKRAGECYKGALMSARPSKAQYTILVAGDNPASLRVSARLGWYNMYGARIGDCASSGLLEAQLEQAIRDRAARP